jgi:hypothetical protein
VSRIERTVIVASLNPFVPREPDLFASLQSTVPRRCRFEARFTCGCLVRQRRWLALQFYLDDE